MRAYIEGAGHKTVESLAADAMTANKMIGAKAGGGAVLQVPRADRSADPAGWKAFDKALGVPEDGKYAAFKPETGNLNLSETQIGVLDRTMATAGAPPAARDAALKAYHELASAARQAEDEAWNREVTAGNQKLKAEWGDGYERNQTLAARAIEDHLGKDFVKLMSDSGMIDHPLVKEAGYKLVTLTAEAGAPPRGDGKAGLVPSKSQAKEELARIEASDGFKTGSDTAALLRRAELLEIIHG